VGNAGRSGLNSFSHLTQLHVYVPYLRPQLVVVLAGINDLNQCISGGRQVVEQNAAGIDKPGVHDEYASVVFTEVLEPRPWWYPRLVDLVRQPLTRLQRRTPEDVGDYVVQDQAGGFYLAQRARRMAAEKVDVVPDVATCLDAFEANLERMVDRARRQGFDLLLLTQGALYRDDLTADEQALLWFGSVDENPFAAKAPERYFTVRAMSRMLHAYNERTRKVCAQRDIACVDVARELPPTTETYYDDVHFNPQGSRRLGDLLIPVVAGLIEGR
jgi:lysophospholipase L1-like esterase